MDVKCSAVAAIKKGMSIRAAAKKFGITRSTLCDHLTILNRTNPVDNQRKENLLPCAIEAVTSGRCSASRAASAYGVPERTVRCRLKNPRFLFCVYFCLNKNPRPLLLRSLMW